MRMLGFDVVAGWLACGVLGLLMMADTVSGSVAGIALRLFGPTALIGPETFVLGLPLVAAPLVLLAWLPRHTRFPLLAGIQSAVKPETKPVRRRRR